jgi:hypothetical protein
MNPRSSRHEFLFRNRRRVGAPRNLHRRARHRAVRAEDAAVAGCRPQRRAAGRAPIDDPTGVARHLFRLRCPAMRTGDDRSRDGVASRRGSALIGRAAGAHATAFRDARGPLRTVSSNRSATTAMPRPERPPPTCRRRSAPTRRLRSAPDQVLLWRLVQST